MACPHGGGTDPTAPCWACLLEAASSHREDGEGHDVGQLYAGILRAASGNLGQQQGASFGDLLRAASADIGIHVPSDIGDEPDVTSLKVRFLISEVVRSASSGRLRGPSGILPSGSLDRPSRPQLVRRNTGTDPSAPRKRVTFAEQVEVWELPEDDKEHKRRELAALDLAAPDLAGLDLAVPGDQWGVAPGAPLWDIGGYYGRGQGEEQGYWPPTAPSPSAPDARTGYFPGAQPPLHQQQLRPGYPPPYPPQPAAFPPDPRAALRALQAQQAFHAAQAARADAAVRALAEQAMRLQAAQVVARGQPGFSGPLPSRDAPAPVGGLPGPPRYPPTPPNPLAAYAHLHQQSSQPVFYSSLPSHPPYSQPVPAAAHFRLLPAAPAPDRTASLPLGGGGGEASPTAYQIRAREPWEGAGGSRVRGLGSRPATG